MAELFSSEGIDRVLCAVAHPDDMEYGASAAVAEWTSQGVEVAYLLLTAGEAGIRHMRPEEVAPMRAEEQRAACDIVGVKDLKILDFTDGLLEANPETRAAIAREIRRFQPQAVVCTTWELEVPWGINHVDHRAAGLATVDAMRDADNPWLYQDQIAEGLEAWSTKWLLVTGTEATHAIEVSEDSVEKGVESLAAHEGYLRALPDHPHPREIVEGTTRGGGEAAGVPFALGVRAIQMG